MPLTAEGITPDLTIHPHAIPSRDATPFTGFTVESVFMFLRQRRYQSRGLEVMYHGHGRKPHAQVYLRPTYYQRLKHMVDDKIHSRARGLVQILTRQPVVGRSRDDGLHFGEMERGCMVSHGIAGFLNERFCEARDAYCLDVCNICGRTAIANPEQQNFKCRACKNKTAVYQLHIPYAAKLLSQDAITGVGASHNAEQQYSRGDCLPGTREEVLRIIWEWILSQRKELPICWLSGTAGVGKTAIAMTVAKGCQKEGRLVSSFFFFRSDPKRNNPSALVLTIAHGLVVTNSSCRVLINQRISDDPTILEARIEEQFRKLVVEPYGRQTLPPTQKSSLPQNSSLRQTRSKRVWKSVEKRALAQQEGPDQQGSTKQTEAPNLVIIDGLDECGDEQTQRRVLSMIQSAFHSAFHSSLRFLICSRPEAWLQEAFADASLSEISKIILLNDQFRPAKDIMKYYRHQFQKVVSNPRYKQVRFPVPWPSVKDLETLVDKSCSQFVYAATVSRFIAHGDEHPMDQLRLILKSAPNSHPGASPYEALDTLYSIILMANRSPDKVHPILAAIVVLTQFEEEREEEYLKPTPACIELLL
ncbi:DNA-dependent RNA polymerase II, partial [Marasmius sp. AFHP31]